MQHFLLTRKKLLITACFLLCLGATVSMAQTVTVTITQNGGQTDPSNSTSIFFTATFSEAVSGFGSEVADVTVGGTAGATTAVVTGSGFSYTVEVTGMTTDGTVTISIPAAAATASAPPGGRTNQLSIDADNSVTYDATAPIITASSTINLTPSQFTLRVNADENSTVYYVVTTSAVAPNAGQIIAGNDENSVAAFKSGNAAGTAGVDLDQIITGLAESTTYYIYSVAADAATNNSAVDSESATTPCTPTNVTNLKIGDTNTTATLYWSDPTCFDEIIIAAKLGSGITGAPSGDGTAYTTNLNFSTASAADFDASAKIVFKGGAGTGGGAGQTVTNLTVGNVYYFKIFTRKGTTWSSGNSTSAATGAPSIVSLVPTDNSTGISTDQIFTVTFNENIFISATAASGDEDDIRFSYSGTDPVVSRGSTGAGTIGISGKTATVTLTSDLDVNEAYNILIGNKVFRDSSANDFGGTVAGDWNFTTASGAAVTAPTVGTCAGQFTALGDIVITETSDNNFQGVDNGSRTIVLSFDKSGFIFNPSVTGVVATPAPGGDIASITTTSVSFTQATFTVQFSNVSNDGQAKDDHDAITITGLKVSRDGSNAPPAILWLDNASTLTIQGISEQAASPALATINGGTVPTAPTITYPAGDNTYCVNATFSGINISASDPDVAAETFNWYDDAGLTVVNATNATSRTVAQLIGGSPSAGTYTRYATQVDGCESAAATVTIVITSLPTASAGANQTGAGAVCPTTSVSLGGSPTASGGTGSYSYAWTGPGSPTAVSNPNHIVPDPGGSNQIYNYQVTVTDGNGCVSSPAVKQVEVKTVSQNVSFAQPTSFSFTSNANPINLVGNPAGGTFSGVGIIHLSGNYQFDPELAGINAGWPITYTVTLANGCTKSIVQNFEVVAPSDVFPNFGNAYCNNETFVNLDVSAATINAMVNYVTNWNANYTIAPYFYSPLKVNFTGVVRNVYETHYGDNNSVIQSGGTYVSGGKTLNRYRFFPTAIQTDQSYPPAGGTSGVCSNCPFATLYVYIEYADPLFTAPDNMAVGYDDGYSFNNGTTAGFAWNGEGTNVRPVPVVNFSGLNGTHCNINTDYQLTGNKAGGEFEISDDNSAFGDVVGDGIKDIDEGQPGGLGLFNPLDAVGAVSNPTIQYVRYSVDPGTVGSTGQACVGRITKSTTVYPSTPILFDPSVPPPGNQFCYEDAAVNIITDAGTPPSTGSITFSGFGIANNVDGTAIFTPQTAFEQKNPGSTNPESITITATYTNAQGCAYPLTRNFIVNPKPTSVFSVTDQVTTNPPPDLNFCYNDNPLVLQGNSSTGTVQYFIDYTTLSYTETQTLDDDNITFDPSAYFDDFDLQGGTNVSDATFTVRYVVTDALGCTASSSKNFAVSPLADIEFFGAASGDLICENVTPFNITFSPIGGTLKVETVPTPLINNALPFTSLAPNNSIDLEYTYNSGVSQCTTVETITISKIAAPVAQFSAPPVCDGDAANYTSVSNTNNYTWKWILGDSIRSGTDKETLNHIFPGLAQGATQTSYKIRLIVENDFTNGGALKVCRDSVERDQIIGAYPKVDFNYSDVCEGDFTRFTISSNIPIATAQWDFGDGLITANNQLNTDIPPGTHGGQTQGKYGQPEHKYALGNRYTVGLIGRTASNVGACANTISRQVAILRKLVPTPATPYNMATVNNGDGYWIEEDRGGVSTWEFAAPTGKDSIKNTVGNVWVTNATGDYLPKDNSYMNSPCFDLTAFSKPVFGLQFWGNSDGGKDGAVLQFSVNGGTTWQVVGTPTSGINWYNVQTISSAPGGFNQFGWTGRLQKQWIIGKNSLDLVAGNNKVRFRIAFASDEREEYDGFAFNNVIIEERNRIMLVEHFTNAVTSNAKVTESNSNFNTDPALNDGGTEVVKLQYHTSFPATDAINANNPADHNARAAFYGVTSQTMPLGFIDGGRDLSANFGFVSPPNPPWWNDFKQKRSLNASPYILSVQTVPSASADELTVHVTGTRVGVVPGNRPVLHVVVIEKDVAGNQHVVRKLLPNASGTALNPTAATIDQTLVTRSEGLTDLTDLAIVVFIQDEVTKEIHQATLDLAPANLPTLITEVEDPEYAERISMFPNPANQEINIELPSAVSKATAMRVVDTYGRTLVEQSFAPGEIRKVISTKELLDGIYIMQIVTPEGKNARRKVMVMHR